MFVATKRAARWVSWLKTTRWVSWLLHGQGLQSRCLNIVGRGVFTRHKSTLSAFQILQRWEFEAFFIITKSCFSFTRQRFHVGWHEESGRNRCFFSRPLHNYSANVVCLLVKVKLNWVRDQLNWIDPKVERKFVYIKFSIRILLFFLKLYLGKTRSFLAWVPNLTYVCWLMFDWLYAFSRNVIAP